MVATYEIMLESKLGGNSAHRRRGSSISSVASATKESSSMSSESGIGNTLIHKEAVEVSGGPTSTTDQQFGSPGDLLPDTPIPRHRHSRSKESGLRQEPKSRLSTGVAHREINQDPLQYPGAAAQSRCFGTGFRWVEGANSAGISPPRLNVNGADTYQIVGNNPISRVDPKGLTYWESYGPFGPVVINGQVEVYFIRELRPSWYNLLDRAIGAQFLATNIQYYPINNISPCPANTLAQRYQYWLGHGGSGEIQNIEHVESARNALWNLGWFPVTQWFGAGAGAAGGGSSEGAGSVGNDIGISASGGDAGNTISEQGK
jgi:hypothetical protein